MTIWQQETLAGQLWTTGKSPIPIYDMHGHMGDSQAIYHKRCQAEEMVKHLKRIGVTRLVFSHMDALAGIMRNAEVLEICKRYPDILRMYIAINPHHPEYIKEDLAAFKKFQPYAVGLKFLPAYHKVAVTAPAYEYALKFADEHALPVLFHTWGNIPENNGKVMLETVQKYSRLKFFIAHCIYGEWDYAERCVKESNGNVWLELTAIPGVRGLVEKLVRQVGSERLLFGTDMPWFDEYQAVGGILAARISEEDRHNILYRNVENILGRNF